MAEVGFWNTVRLLDLAGLKRSRATAATIGIDERWADAGVTCAEAGSRGRVGDIRVIVRAFTFSGTTPLCLTLPDSISDYRRRRRI